MAAPKSPEGRAEVRFVAIVSVMGGETASGPEPVDAPVLETRRPATDAERRALASVLRLRILRLCLYESLTNKELADRLGRDPASVLHHVRTLLSHGFLRAEEPRPGPRGSTEVPYRGTGKSWLLDFGTPEDMPVEQPTAAATIEPGSQDLLLRTFLEEVSQVSRAEVFTTRLGLQLSAGHRAEFGYRMQALLDEFAARGPDEAGDRWSVFVGMHPEPQPGRR
jgi:hypothetical protein